MNNIQSVTLSFNQNSATIRPDATGMYDLNDIWRAFGLAKNKRPAQWRGEIANQLKLTANLQSGRNASGVTLRATQMALYQYAAWVSIEFNSAVFTAFTHLSNGKLFEAKESADTVALVELRQHLTAANVAMGETIASGIEVGQFKSGRHAFSLVRDLAVKSVTGLTSAAFKRRHNGMSPRVFYFQQRDMCKLMALNAAEEKVKLMVEMGLDYSDIKASLKIAA